MSVRTKLSVLLVLFGFTAFVLPDRENNLRQPELNEYFSFLNSEDKYFSADELAGFVVSEDSTIQIIDLRSREEFLAFNIPGSVNIPFEDLYKEEYRGFTDQDKVKNILYSNGETISNQALALLVLSGFEYNYILKGGMNSWYEEVMLSEFSGDKISIKENRLFETRYKARRYFNEINSLPDSLKLKFLEIKKIKESELVGGCE